MSRIFPTTSPPSTKDGHLKGISRNASGLKKFKLLLWKNYKIQSRHYIQAVLEVLLPLLFTIVLVIVRDIVKSNWINKPTIYKEFNPAHPPFIVEVDCDEIYFTPKNEVVERLMGIVHHNYFNSNGINYKFIGFRTEDELVSAYEEKAKGASLQNKTHVSDSTVPVLAGVVFHNSFNPTGSGFLDEISYSLRFPAQQRTDFDLISERFGLKAAWFTEIAFPLFQFLGPRALDSPEGGLPGYYAEGFLYLQQGIDKGLLSLLLNEDAKKEMESTDLLLQRFPYPPYIEDKYLFALQAWLPLLMMLSFVYPVINITKSIVYEKEKRLKESMKMMGLENSLHWAAWFIKSFLFLLTSIILMTILLKSRFSAVQELAVLSYVGATILFTMLFAFIFQVIGFSFFVSTLASSANSGATAAGVFWFIFFSPYFFIQPRYNLLSRGLKISSCFFTNNAIALACQILCVFEGTGTGLQWGTFWEGSGPDDSFCMGDCVVMMLVNAITFFIVALYIEGVWPGEYGVPLPWNFPIQKWYWTGGVRGPPLPKSSSVPLVSLRNVQPSFFEPEPTGPENVAGIQILNLSKTFKEKSAVNNLNLNMFENQITALLGHNGAGKTTTMSMLTGLYPSTSGSAIINGFDISTDISSVRSSLGICPQHDVLFDEMTVEEHLKFFCLLKGFDEDLMEGEINRMLKCVGLENKRKAQSHSLSGGMKRKLSVGIALCGGSKVVLLDEPTSGMDPSARRSTWDLIQTEKKGRTILLSTHFMEEADLLGDRIAIMAEGELQCCGSSLFLKKKYGGGYHLIIVKEPTCVVDGITELLRVRIPDVEIDGNIGAELSYSLPETKSEYFPEMFGELEKRKTELGIASYGASITTMEEVFIRVGREAERRITRAFELQQQQTGGNQGHITQVTPEGHDEEEKEESFVRNSGVKHLAQQMWAMLVKKWIYSVRNRQLLLGQMAIPSLYLVIVLGSLKTFPGLESPPLHLLKLSRYETISRTWTVVHCTNLTPVCGGYKNYLDEKGYRIQESNGGTFIEHILKVGEDDLTRLNFKFIVGYEERAVEDGRVHLVGFFNNQPFHTPPLAYNLLTNAILRAYTNYSLEISNHPFPYSNLDVLKEAGNLYTIGFQVGYNINFGMSFLAASYVVFLIMERETGSKHLQFVSGLKFPIFWIGNYIVDVMSFLIPSSLIVLCLIAFQVDDFINLDVLGHLMLLLGLFGVAVIPYMYIWSFGFTVPATGFTRMTMFNVFTGMATMLTFTIVSIPELRLSSVANTLNDIFLIFPNYALGVGIVQLATIFQIQQQCKPFEEVGYCLAFPNNFCCVKAIRFLDWRIPGIGKNLIMMSAVGCISFTAILLLESKILTRIKRIILKPKEFADDPQETQEMLAVDDSDVRDENERIRNTNLNQLFQTDNLILRDLTKYYGDFTAVDKLNLGVQCGQTFGLLGVNGAGKTTSFKMLTGDITVSAGDAFVHSHSVRNALENVHRNVGYCPQFDGVIGEMTGRETLRLFARLRGIPEARIPALTEILAHRLIFSQHIDKEVRHYSGGNKRKLSTAMALVGNPPIVFLDEPTTGMDPVARRHLWNAIAIFRDSGTSIVLTSHSMEECEALCSRLAIMVNGKFRCLGSPQHLKNKFGEGYTLIAQTTPRAPEEGLTRAQQEAGRRRSSLAIDKRTKSAIPAQRWENDLEGLRNFIETSFPDSILKDIHPGFVHYHLVPSLNVSWGQIFEKMEIAKEKFHLDAYSVGQTSLEQVFLNFTKAQINVPEAKPKRKLLRFL